MPAPRNTSPADLFLALGRQVRPTYGFDPARLEGWRDAALPAVLATLRSLPDRVDPRPELLSEVTDGGVTSQRWLIDVEDGLSAIAVVNRPEGTAPAGGWPGILCWHGHSPFGKEAVMGNTSTAEIRAFVADSGLNYGFRMAQHGFVTFGIDWMGSGAQNDRLHPNNRPMTSKDTCDLYYLHAALLGRTVLGMNLCHGRQLLDFVSDLGFVDGQRLGVMGESYGGTLACWQTLFDDRIKATEIICYSDTFTDFGLRDGNYCGSQITPGLFTLVDVSDLHGLIAPGPLLTDLAVYDECFLLPSAKACIDRVEGIYAAYEALDHFERQTFTSGHGWQDRRSAPFFAKHLAPST